jgi:PIN domain nuclease of toxin-antitoxin system
VKALLDTHALIWALEGSRKLSRPARRFIESAQNEIIVSAASAWEIAIKKSLGRLSTPGDLAEAIDSAGFTRRPLGFAEASRLEYLPALHSDPFDRMLIAHALEEGAAIVTKDEQIARYPVRVIW